MWDTVNTHPLTSRSNSYSFDQTLFSVHSEDRDIGAWPVPSQFQFALPSSVSEVQSISLGQISVPTPRSLPFPRARLKFAVEWVSDPTSYEESPTALVEISDADADALVPQDFKGDLTNLLAAFNKACLSVVTKWYSLSASDPAPTLQSVGAALMLVRDPTSGIIQFKWMTTGSSPQQAHNIKFRVAESDDYQDRGILGALGFFAPSSSSGCPTNRGPILAPSGGSSTITASQPPCLILRKVIYMELEGYNGLGESYPISRLPSRPQVAGNANAALAKLPSPLFKELCPNALFIENPLVEQNFVLVPPPGDKVSSLKVTFRFHDGEIVDFGVDNLDFTIVMSRLQNEIPRLSNIRTPLGLRPT